MLAADVEKLKARSGETIAHLRQELSSAREQVERTDKRYVQLRQAYSYVSDQFDVAAAQILSLESACRRLGEETDACRRRAIVAEQALHENVMGFADNDGRVALGGDLRTFVARVHRYFPALLSRVNTLSERNGAGKGL
jgi:hypothetical protein